MADVNKHRAILLSVCGPKTYQLVHNLAVPGKPTGRDFTALVKLIGDHYSPAPSVIVQRYKFNSWICQQGESIATYIVKLRRLSEFCQFEDTLDDMLRDRLVCGVNDPSMQRHLLSEMKLDFKRALELAQAMESADKNAHDLQTMFPVAAATLHQLDKRAASCPQPSSGSYYRCGGEHRVPLQRCRLLVVWEEGPHSEGLPKCKEVGEQQGGAEQGLTDEGTVSSYALHRGSRHQTSPNTRCSSSEGTERIQ